MIRLVLLHFLKERFRQFSTYFLFTLFFALSLTCFLLTYHKGGPLYKTLSAGMNEIKVNAPFIVYFLTAIVFQYCILLTVYFFGRLGLRDFHHNTYQLVFTTPVKKSTYITANLISEILRHLFIFSGIGFGACIATSFYSTSPMTAHITGSFILPYITNIIPNLVIFGVFSYLLTLFTRKLFPVYLITTSSIILKIFAGITTQLESTVLSIFLDPFGISALSSVIKTWSITEKNTFVIALQNEIVLNRLFWLLITATFAYIILKKINLSCSEDFSKKSSPTPIPCFTHCEPQKDYSSKSFLHTVLQIARQDFRYLCKNRFFIMITSLATLILLIVGYKYVGIVRNTQTYPVTYEILKISENIFIMFVFMIIAFTTAESVWRDRDLKSYLYLDTLPTRNSAWMIGKLISVSTIVFVLMTLFMIIGIVIQTLHGYFKYDFGQYLITLFLIRWVQFSLIAIVSLILQVIAPKKYIGYIMVIIFYAMPDIIYDFISQHNLAIFANIMSIIYSDMNGFDVYLTRSLLFNGYWAGISVLFISIGIGCWKNGYLLTLRYRFSSFMANMNRNITFGALVGLLFIGIFGTTAYYTTTKTNLFINDTAIEENAVNYEKTYKSYCMVPHPKITKIVLDTDLYPSKRYCTVQGTLTLENTTTEPITEIFLEFPDGAKSVSVSMGTSAHLKIDDISYNIKIFSLLQTLQPQDSLEISYSFRRENFGIKNSGHDRDIIPNGSFLYYFDLIPGVGYDANRHKEITDTAKRAQYGLPPHQQYSNNPDTARMHAMICKDADYVTLQITVGTENDQTTIAPGTCRKQWKENNRTYTRYVSDQPILKYFAIFSGRYNVAKDTWQSLPVEVYYHPEHTYNIGIMMEAIKNSLTYCTANFSDFPYGKIQIVEFPRYEIYAESFPGVIPISEGFGFIARFKPDSVEYVYRTIAHEIGHQWWAHIVTCANYPGHQMLTEMLAQYTAVALMKKRYSVHAFDTTLKNTVKDYFKGRRRATEYEPSMMKTTPEHPYVHYEKSIIIMNALQEYIGEKTCNNALRNYCRNFATTKAPFALSSDLYKEFEAVTPTEFHYLLNEWLNNVTLYSITVTNSSYVAVDKNSYVVSLSYSLEKFSFSNNGESTRLETDTHVQISIYDKNGKEYKMIKLLKNNTGTIEIPVDFKPESAGLNTHYLLIEKDYNDNTVKCVKTDKNISI